MHSASARHANMCNDNKMMPASEVRCLAEDPLELCCEHFRVPGRVWQVSFQILKRCQPSSTWIGRHLSQAAYTGGQEKVGARGLPLISDRRRGHTSCERAALQTLRCPSASARPA